MSKDIFMADYSNCRDTKRETQSNLNYIEEILGRLTKMSNHVDKVSLSGDIWNRADYDYGYSTLKNYLGEETTRYSNFYTEFDSFYTPLESVDKALKAVLEKSLSYVDQNEEYGVYMAIIKSSQVESLRDAIYDELIRQGVSEEDALKISALQDESTIELMEHLLTLDEKELKAAIEGIQSKEDKSLSELILIDILALDSHNTYGDTLKDVLEQLTDGGLSAVLQGKFVGKTIDQYNLDIKSLTGRIDQLTRQLANPDIAKSAKKVKLKQETLDNLTALRETKVANAARYDKAANGLAKAQKWLGIAGQVYAYGKVALEDIDNFANNGYELDDAVVDTAVDSVGIAASAYVGGKAGAALGGKIGGLFGSAPGAAAGVVGGFVVGGLAGAAYDGLIKPIIIDGYNEYVEPAAEKAVDEINNLGDWWDSLWW